MDFRCLIKCVKIWILRYFFLYSAILLTFNVPVIPVSFYVLIEILPSSSTAFNYPLLVLLSIGLVHTTLVKLVYMGFDSSFLCLCSAVVLDNMCMCLKDTHGINYPIHSTFHIPVFIVYRCGVCIYVSTYICIFIFVLMMCNVVFVCVFPSILSM